MMSGKDLSHYSIFPSILIREISEDVRKLGKDGVSPVDGKSVPQIDDSLKRVSESAPEIQQMSSLDQIRSRTSLMKFSHEWFDLEIPDKFDSTYISNRIIISGRFWEGESNKNLRRNNVREMSTFLNSKLGDSYLIWNLACDKSMECPYDTSLFGDQVIEFDFRALSSLEITRIFDFCRSLHAWLLLDKKNVAIVHCDTGIQRTGLLISCYLCYSRIFDSGFDALNFFSERRIPGGGNKWITPTTLRYVGYFSGILQSGGKVKNKHHISLQKVSIGGLGYKADTSNIFIDIYHNGSQIYNSLIQKRRPSRIISKSPGFTLEGNALTFRISPLVKGAPMIAGDVQIFVCLMKTNKGGNPDDYTTIMSFCFHTGFVVSEKIRAFSGDMEINAAAINGGVMAKIYMDIEVEIHDDLTDVVHLWYGNHMQKGLLSCLRLANKYHHVPTDQNAIRGLKSRFNDVPTQLIAFCLKRRRNNVQGALELLKQLKGKGAVSFDLKQYRRSMERATNKPGLSTLVNPVKLSMSSYYKPSSDKRDGGFTSTNSIFERYLDINARRPSVDTLEESRRLLQRANGSKADENADGSRQAAAVTPTEKPQTGRDNAGKRSHLTSLIRDLDNLAMDADKLADDEDDEPLGLPPKTGVSTLEGHSASITGNIPSEREKVTPRKEDADSQEGIALPVKDISPLRQKGAPSPPQRRGDSPQNATSPAKLNAPERVDSFGESVAKEVLSQLKDSDGALPKPSASANSMPNVPDSKGTASPKEQDLDYSSYPTLTRDTSNDIKISFKGSLGVLEPKIEKSPSSEALLRHRSIEMKSDSLDSNKLIRSGISASKLNSIASRSKSSLRTESGKLSPMGVLERAQRSLEASEGPASLSDKEGPRYSSSSKPLMSSTSFAKCPSNLTGSSRRTNSPLLKSLSSLSLTNLKSGYINSNEFLDQPGLYIEGNKDSILNNYEYYGDGDMSHSDSNKNAEDRVESLYGLASELDEADLSKKDGGYTKDDKKKGKRGNEYSKSSRNNGSFTRHPPPSPPPPPTSSSSNAPHAPPPQQQRPPPRPQSPPPSSSNAADSSANNASSLLSALLPQFHVPPEMRRTETPYFPEYITRLVPGQKS